ncbi:hypothetical protein DVH24_041864 [Malus domestica]|uniref:Uncharacterized protein n=1 Tax=Malus domestica TaxID=3750 RepID=A0A498IP14_MALDO|nr:hypothetical protein DVH24_041864 [Malus domestica]
MAKLMYMEENLCGKLLLCTKAVLDEEKKKKMTLSLGTSHGFFFFKAGKLDVQRVASGSLGSRQRQYNSPKGKGELINQKKVCHSLSARKME